MSRYIRSSIKVASIVDTMTENRLKWLGHVSWKKRDAVRLVKEIFVEEKRRKENRKKIEGELECYEMVCC